MRLSNPLHWRPSYAVRQSLAHIMGLSVLVMALVGGVYLIFAVGLVEQITSNLNSHTGQQLRVVILYPLLAILAIYLLWRIMVATSKVHTNLRVHKLRSAEEELHTRAIRTRIQETSPSFYLNLLCLSVVGKFPSERRIRRALRMFIPLTPEEREIEKEEQSRLGSPPQKLLAGPKADEQFSLGLEDTENFATPS